MKHILCAILFSAAASNEVEATPIGFEQGYLLNQRSKHQWGVPVAQCGAWVPELLDRTSDCNQ